MIRLARLLGLACLRGHQWFAPDLGPDLSLSVATCVRCGTKRAIV